MTTIAASSLATRLAANADGTILLNGVPLLTNFVDVGGREHAARAALEGEWIVFEGSITGSHRVAADGRISSAERVYAHWSGYVANAMAAADSDFEDNAAVTLKMARAS